jgi:hypothetical protein
VVEVDLPVALRQQVVIPIFYMPRIRRNRVRKSRPWEQDVAARLAEDGDDHVQRFGRAVRQKHVAWRVLQAIFGRGVELRKCVLGRKQPVDRAVPVVSPGLHCRRDGIDDNLVRLKQRILRGISQREIDERLVGLGKEDGFQHERLATVKERSVL